MWHWAVDRPVWARLILGIGAAVMVVGVVAMALPIGQVSGNGVRVHCEGPWILGFPSEPYPEADPHYAASQTCFSMQFRRMGLAVLIVAAGGGTIGAGELAARRALRSGRPQQRPPGREEPTRNQ